LPALAALAITAVLVGGVVGLTLRGDNGADRSSSAGRSTTQSAAARERDRTTTGSEGERAAAAGEAQQTQPDRAQQTQPNPAPPSTPAQTSDPAALNNRGYERIQAGDYAGAVEPLRAAVRGYRDAGRTGELNYYFALYNLAVALARSGDPAGAIPILRERLRNPNQRVTVQRELDKAQAQVGDGKPGKKDEEQPGYEPEALGRTGQ
jgi:tetratricopeptide (TPR) repeat protein